MTLTSIGEKTFPYICKCGSKDFHTFSYYASRDLERFRCTKCKQEYEREGKNVKEIQQRDMSLKYK